MPDTPQSLAAELSAVDAEIADASAAYVRSMNDAMTAQTAALTTYTATVEPLWAKQADLNARVAKLPVPTTPPTAKKIPGDPGPGKIRWGCSYTNNGVPAAHETAAGVPVGVRRTFWRLDQAASIIATAKADIAAGRVPWVSIKLTPLATWAETAAGKIDAQLTNLFVKLGALPGPVWFTAHHEPEGGNNTPYPDEGQGSEVHWRNMQAHVRVVLNGTKVTNIAFASIIMAWTFDTRSGRKPADWWVPGVWDFAGIDHYVEASSTELMTAMWDNALAFYTGKGMRIALGEWGNKDHLTTGANEMQAWYSHLISVGVLGAAYFDTDQNGGVPLSGAALTKFRELMKAPTSVDLREVP